ncbi:uncharacterized protein [Chironomus tepperi]|uniref:uncharacterized protein isoform X2 n=1 Tax=Chironomus tepperi TaxID=113505 RepID=UPI00391F8B24
MLKKIIFKVLTLCFVTAAPQYGRQNTGLFPLGQGGNPQLGTIAGGFLQQGAQFVNQVANNVLGQVFRPGSFPSQYPGQFPPQYPGQFGYPNQGQYGNPGGRPSYRPTPHDHHHHNHGQTQPNAIPTVQTVAPTVKPTARPEIPIPPPPVNPNKKPIPPPSNLNRPNPPVINPPQQGTDGDDLDELLNILDKNSQDHVSTQSPNKDGYDYDFDVRVDEKPISRQKRNDELIIPETEEKLDPKNKPETEEVELENRFLGGIGKKVIGQGINALRQGVDVAGKIIQGGFHFPSNEPEYVPAHLRPPPNRPQKPGNKPVIPSPPNSQLGGSATNAQGQAQNTAGGFNQNAGANTHSSNVQNELGSFQNTGGSSISANLANDGSSGQLGAANTQQSSQHTADGYKEQNAAQSQSANFDNQGNLQLSNAGTNVNVIKEKDRERVETLGSSSSHNKNQFGTSNSAANTNTVQFNEGGVMGSQSTSQGQSTHIGTDGSLSGSQTNAGTQQFTGPGGLQGTSSSSMSSSFNQGGSGNSSSSSGSSANSGSFGGSGASSSASTNTGSFGHPHGFQFSVAESKSFSASGSIPHGADISKIPLNLGFPLG